MAPHSSILAWRITWTEESGRLQSMGLQESDTTEHKPILGKAQQPETWSQTLTLCFILFYILNHLTSQSPGGNPGIPITLSSHLLIKNWAFPTEELKGKKCCFLSFYC